MSINIPVSKVSGGACWVYLGHTLKGQIVEHRLHDYGGCHGNKPYFLRKLPLMKVPQTFLRSIYIYLSKNHIEV